MSRRLSPIDTVRQFGRKLGKPLLLVLTIFYLGFHALTGERGLFAWFTESRKLETLKAELADVTARREALDHKVRLMSDGSLDLDMLDEQSRRVLGMAGKGETVIFTDKSSN